MWILLIVKMVFPYTFERNSWLIKPKCSGLGLTSDKSGLQARCKPTPEICESHYGRVP